MFTTADVEPEPESPDTATPAFAPVHFETEEAAAQWQTPEIDPEHGDGRAVVFCSPAKCETLVGTACANHELTVFQSTSLVVVGCGSAGVPGDLFRNMCSAVSVDETRVPVYYDIDPLCPNVWSVAVQIGHTYGRMVTPCTLKMPASGLTEFTAFF